MMGVALKPARHNNPSEIPKDLLLEVTMDCVCCLLHSQLPRAGFI